MRQKIKVIGHFKELPHSLAQMSIGLLSSCAWPPAERAHCQLWAFEESAKTKQTIKLAVVDFE